MTDLTREQLSAFVDDELETGEAELLVRRLNADFDLRGAALRYALMGDAIRGDLLAGDPRDLPGRISRAIGADKAPIGAGDRRPFRGLLRPLAGAAVAASVAVVAILSLSSPGEQVPVPAEVTVPDSPAVMIAPASPSAIFRAGSPTQLNRYYLNHSQYATALGGQGSLIRMVRTPVSSTDEDMATDKDQDQEENSR
jgi:sigma-E factor negative regulatory protein RseA